jgi:ribulose bisphosphate carboxylase small subunit
MKAYQFIKVYPEIKTSIIDIPQPITPILAESSTKREENYLVAEAKYIEQVKALLAKGYKYEMEYEGIKLFTKK